MYKKAIGTLPIYSTIPMPFQISLIGLYFDIFGSWSSVFYFEFICYLLVLHFRFDESTGKLKAGQIK